MPVNQAMSMNWNYLGIMPPTGGEILDIQAARLADVEVYPD
jgi:hypothetical protein